MKYIAKTIYLESFLFFAQSTIANNQLITYSYFEQNQFAAEHRFREIQ